MTYDQFWNEDCELVKFYRKAAQIRRDLKNQDAWVQGAYFYEALIDVAPTLRSFGKNVAKPTPYREKPFDLFSKQDEKKREEIQEENDNKAKAVMEAFAIAINKKFQEKGGGVNG